MLDHRFVLPEGILVLNPESPLETADFAALGRQIDPYIAAHGNLPGLMIHAKVFPGWANIEALLAHVKFIEGHLQKVQKLAIVSDNPILTEVPKIVAPLVHAEVKHFAESEYEAALRWLKAPPCGHLSGGQPPNALGNRCEFDEQTRNAKPGGSNRKWSDSK